MTLDALQHEHVNQANDDHKLSLVYSCCQGCQMARASLPAQLFWWFNVWLRILVISWWVTQLRGPKRADIPAKHQLYSNRKDFWFLCGVGGIYIFRNNTIYMAMYWWFKVISLSPTTLHSHNTAGKKPDLSSSNLAFIYCIVALNRLTVFKQSCCLGISH